MDIYGNASTSGTPLPGKSLNGMRCTSYNCGRDEDDEDCHGLNPSPTRDRHRAHLDRGSTQTS